MNKFFVILILLLFGVSYEEGFGLWKDLEIKEILKTGDLNPYKVHIFSNDNILFINEEEELIFTSVRSKQKKLILKLNNGTKFFNVDSFFLVDDICFLENDGEIWAINSSGSVRNFTINKDDIVRMCVKSTLTPIDDNNIIYFNGSYIILYNMNTKEVIRKYKFPLKKDDITSRFIINSTNVFNSNGEYIFSINLKDGHFDWITRINKKEIIKGTNDPNFIVSQTLINNKLVFCTNEYIYIIDSKTGKILQRIRKEGSIPSSFFKYANDYIIALSSSLIAIDITSEKKSWELNGVPLHSVLIKDKIFSSDISGFYTITNIKNGSIYQKGKNIIFESNHRFEVSKEHLYLISEGVVSEIVF